MIRHLAAVAATATLLVTTLPTAQAAATGPASRANCMKQVLDLPADSLPGASKAKTADPSGRYIVGDANRVGSMHGQAVLWVDGVPRWLSSQPDGSSAAYSVLEDGLVLGSTYTMTTTEHWIYSVKSDSYRILDVPENLNISLLAAMNANQDIVGTAWDEKLGEEVPFVWPADGQPQLLPMPSDHFGYAMDDISDEGLIIGRLVLPEGVQTSFLWKSWNTEPTRLPGADQADEYVWAQDIEGQWIAGGDSVIDDATGLLWHTRHTGVEKLEESVIDLNSSRDAVTAVSFDNRHPAMIIWRDGTKITFPEGTHLTHMFERNLQWTAAGYDVSSGELEPVVYACT